MWKSWEFKYFQLQSANSEFNNNIVLGILWANWMMLLCKVMKEFFFLFSFTVSLQSQLLKCEWRHERNFTFALSRSIVVLNITLISTETITMTEDEAQQLAWRDDMTSRCYWLLQTWEMIPNTNQKKKIATTDKMKRKVVKFMLTMSWDWLPLNLGSVAWCHCIVVSLSIT